MRFKESRGQLEGDQPLVQSEGGWPIGCIFRWEVGAYSTDMASPSAHL